VAVGFRALYSNTLGTENTAIGYRALSNNTEGTSNIAIGFLALQANTISTENIAVGDGALDHNTTGSSNVSIGSGTLSFNTTGSGNIVLGQGAGENLTTENDNILIGALGSPRKSGTIQLGTPRQTSVFIQGISGVAVTGSAVFVDNFTGQLGVQPSSARFKDDIKPMEMASEAVLALRPVTFRYKEEIDPNRTAQFGLVAEDVEKVSPDLVVHNKEGKPYSVRYDAVNAMLLNEFLKEHRTVEEQKVTIAQLKQDFQSKLALQQKQIEALTAGLQKVSAKLEASKPAPQVVNNP
jgi:trimeric autotransporter adhesin